ncbi:ABC-type nitrate/sulfonate/bicarbonate transport system, substrate-binding protein [Verrucomicrobium sp. GAS474]|uniref:ABC transporter substrate-binding protein n=1 Tax=Verrucomicrobium sp. GAS474 TaxID=1882831 RepID=UPI00087C6230|nr:NrtA/SsuA/CpmA family ABC transporter substrate-binding protein [Verrucomicrobium sp. GAS474]SDU12380.1 ABC-type nitrate/sulfonate/bicarbonate transport system, substrate-binding protein [Verrucomicrobium sp. GAS474]
MKRLLPLLLASALLFQAQARAEETAVPVRYGYATALHGEIALALDKSGIAKKHGLAVQSTFFQYGPPQVEALAAKSIDLSFTSVVPTANYVAKQPDAVEVVAVLGTSAHGLVVPADSPLRTLADFKGKKIAVAFGTDSHVDLLSSLKAAGLDPAKDVTLINVPPNEQPAALEQKLADGVLLRQPQLYKFTQKGAREIVRWPHQLWVIGRTEWLKENPDAAKRFVAALKETVVFVAKNPKEASAWFGETLRLEPALVEKIAAENPVYAGASDPSKVDLSASPDLRAFVAKRAQELVDFGLSKNLPVIRFAE